MIYSLQALIAVYLVAVVWLVRRQIYQVVEEDMDRIVMTDQRGKTEVRMVEKVLSDKNEILMWFSFVLHIKNAETMYFIIEIWKYKYKT